LNIFITYVYVNIIETHKEHMYIGVKSIYCFRDMYVIEYCLCHSKYQRCHL